MSTKRIIFTGNYKANKGMDFADNINISANKGIYWLDTNDIAAFSVTSEITDDSAELVYTSDNSVRFDSVVKLTADTYYKGTLLDTYFSFFNEDAYVFDKLALFNNNIALAENQSIQWFADDNDKSKFFDVNAIKCDDGYQLVWSSDSAFSYINFALPVKFAGSVSFEGELLNDILDRKLEKADLSAYITSKQFADHTGDTTKHVTESEKAAWNNKQAALTDTQIDAVNSGITSDKVSNYDGYASDITILQGKVEVLEGTHFEVVDSLPSTGKTNTIYLIPKTETEDKNIKDEYIYVNNAWEKIGDTSVDLSQYLKSADAANAYAAKAEVNSKEPTLTGVKLDAVNSGITAAKVSEYDTLLTNSTNFVYKSEVEDIIDFFGTDTYNIDKLALFNESLLIVENQGIHWFADEKLDNKYFDVRTSNTADGQQLIWSSDSISSYINFALPVKFEGSVSFDGELLKDILDRKLEKSDLSDYVTKSNINDYVASPDLSDYITKSNINDYVSEPDLSDYVIKSEIQDIVDFFSTDAYTFDKLALFDNNIALTESKSLCWFADETESGKFFNIRTEAADDGNQLVVCSDSFNSYVNFTAPVKFTGDVSFKDELLEDFINDSITTKINDNNTIINTKIDSVKNKANNLSDKVTTIESNKQDKLTAGQNIAITNNVISVKPTVPELLSYLDSTAASTTLLNHNHIYILRYSDNGVNTSFGESNIINFNAINVEEYATCELWFDYLKETTIMLNSNWVWLDDMEPSNFTVGRRYAIAIRNDGNKILANLAYDYEL